MPVTTTTNAATPASAPASTPAANPAAGSLRLDGKVALITGAGRGMGAGMASLLAERGASVVINYSSSAKAAEALAEDINKSGGKAVAIQANISKTPEVEKLFKEAIDHFGKIDIVINNAGTEAFGPPEEVTEEEYDRVFGLNTRAQFFVAANAMKHLPRGGRIIFMSSVAANMFGVKEHPLYSGSKCAVEAFCRSFSADAGPKGITVNCIAPGGVKTDMFSSNAWHYSPGGTPDTPLDKIEAGIAKMCPLGRVAVPADIARVVAFLAHEDSEWINGQIIKLSGGSVA